MMISQSSIVMAGAHDMSKQYTVTNSIQVSKTPQPQLQQASATVDLSNMPQSEIKKNIQDTAVRNSVENSLPEDTNDIALRLLEILTGRKITIRKFDSYNPTPMQPIPQNNVSGSATHTESYQEQENTSFSAAGVVKTADGKEITFNVSLEMDHNYSQSSTATIRFGKEPPKTDPLVINFGGTAAELDGKTMQFDINNDGNNESIATLKGSSGYLALDLNNNGKIDNSSELFGPNTGNGFSELAQYDADKNGWIDEADPIYSRLQIWKPADGSLISLKDAGIGAIALANQSTPFDIKDSSNKVLGSVQATGVYLMDNGGAGSVQQLDLSA